MKLVGPGVLEIRIHTETEHRVFYTCSTALEKKTQKTPKRDIEVARARLAQVLARRAEREQAGKGQR